MQRRCQSCSAEVADHAKFCRVCGGKLEEIVMNKEENPCPDCGNEIPPGAKFCRHCGSKLTKPVERPGVEDDKPAVAPAKPKPPVCVSCGGELNKTSKFCRTCGASVSGAIKAEDKLPRSVKQSINPGLHQVAVSSFAPEVPGESVFHPPSIPSAASGFAAESGFREAVAYIGPMKILFSGGWRLFTGFFAALKSPGKLMPGVVLGLIWLAVSTLPALGVTLPGQDMANWLTFAQGGLRGGVPGAAGGVFGKGVFAAALIGIFKRTPKRGSHLDKKPPELQKRGGFSLLLIGMGLALILYNFFTWDNSLQNSMIGVLAALGTLRAMDRPNGFLNRMVTALAQGFSPKRMAGHKDVRLLGGGLATGFALAVPMSTIAGPFTGYTLGLVFLLPGMLFAMLRRPGKAVKSA